MSQFETHIQDLIRFNGAITANTLFNLRSARHVVFSDTIIGFDDEKGHSQSAIAKESNDGLYDVQLRSSFRRAIIATGINLQDVFRVFVYCTNSAHLLCDGDDFDNPLRTPTMLLEPDQSTEDDGIINGFYIPLASELKFGIDGYYFDEFAVKQGQDPRPAHATYMGDHPEFQGHQAYMVPELKAVA